MKVWKKRKYLTLLAVLFPTLVSAGVCRRPVSVDGSLRLRTDTRNGVGYMDASTENVWMRARTGMTLCSDNDAHVHFEPQASKVFGDDAVYAEGRGNLDIYQAYVDTDFTENFNFRGGRQALTFGDGLLVGVNDWDNVGRAADALIFTYKFAVGNAHLFYSKLVNGGTASSQDDVRVWGLYTMWSLGEFARNLDLYFMTQDTKQAVSADKPKTTVYGARLKSEISDFDYRLEATFQNTDNRNSKDLSGSQFDIELGYTFRDLYNFRFAAEYFNANEDYLPMYPSYHDYLGMIDVVGRRNINGFRVGLSMMPMDDLKVALNYHKFDRSSKNYQAYMANGLAYASASSSSDLGSEFDFTVDYAVSQKSDMNFGLGFFTPGKYFKDYGNSSKNKDSITFAYLQYVVRF